MALFTVSVVPPIVKAPLGETATFECQVDGNVEVASYAWVGSEKIAKEGRFSYSQNKKVLHVADLRDYDNNTWVDCTVRATGREKFDSGRIVVLASREGWVPPPDIQNGTMEEPIEGGEIPSLTAGGGVVIAIGFILTILAMFGVLRWLKKMEIQKQQDMETARNRYSRIEIGATARARYDRDQQSVNLGGAGGGYAYGEPEEEGENDDSYEDMLPAVPKRSPPPGDA